MDYPSVAVAVYKPFTFYKVRENLEIVDPFGVQKNSTRRDNSPAN